MDSGGFKWIQMDIQVDIQVDSRVFKWMHVDSSGFKGIQLDSDGFNRAPVYKIGDISNNVHSISNDMEQKIKDLKKVQREE